MVGLQIVVNITEGKGREFEQAFDMLTRTGYRSSECLRQELYEEVDKPNRYLWFEYWSDMRSLKEHMKTTQFRAALGAIDVVGCLDDIQIVEYHGYKDLTIQ